MSQNNNDEATAIGMVFAMIGVFIMMVGFAILALAAFASFVLTILALCAWNKPLSLGKVTIEPHEARAFVGRGVFGAFVVPAFVLFCDVLFGLGVDWNYALHIAGVGYVLGSIGVEILMAEDEEGQAGQPSVPAQQQLPGQSQPSPEPQYLPPTAGSQPAYKFRYATWDDEEAGR